MCAYSFIHLFISGFVCYICGSFVVTFTVTILIVIIFAYIYMYVWRYYTYGYTQIKRYRFGGCSLEECSKCQTTNLKIVPKQLFTVTIVILTVIVIIAVLILIATTALIVTVLHGSRWIYVVPLPITLGLFAF